MLLAYLSLIICFQVAAFGQQPPSSIHFPARELDSILQGYVFRAFIRPRTGIVYDGAAPSDLTGIRVAALRLRSGSLRRRGFARFKEFDIPAGVIEQPYVERLVLVYHDLGNWSSLYYPLPGYTFLAPVLGLLAYDAADLSAVDLPELDIRASGNPISVGFRSIGPGPNLRPTCVHFGLDGNVVFDRFVNGTCLVSNQGHFSVVVRSALAPAAAPGPSADGGGGGMAEGGEVNWKRVWIIVGSVVGGALFLVVLVSLLCYVGKYSRRKTIGRMEEAAEFGVPLPMASVGPTKAPVAMETRTRPMLENEFVP
ncbi:Protein of unknown function (DUF1191 [Striga hermonthica]|uniref:Uncharacterized protein n=1 Tax=Striga hermonthica TaxID=68872 RepID=A0A9N7NSH7_STRHE|nr:Protein of unknown function (DUF1191 [Striga hermonthica]